MPVVKTEITHAGDETAWKEKLTRLDELSGELFFDDAPLVFDRDGNRYFWSVALPQDGGAIAAPSTVRVEDLPDAELVFPQSLPDTEQIGQNRSVPFLLYNGESCYEGSLTVTTLPVARLYCDREIRRKKYAPMDFSVWDNQSRTLTQSAGQIKLRGASTRRFPKKSFRLSLKKASLKKKNHVSFTLIKSH